MLAGTAGLTDLDVAGRSGAISIPAASSSPNGNLLEFTNLSTGSGQGHGRGHNGGGQGPWGGQGQGGHDQNGQGQGQGWQNQGGQGWNLWGNDGRFDGGRSHGGSGREQNPGQGRDHWRGGHHGGGEGASSITPGLADISATVPAGYQNVIVQAPGFATLTGNGANGENYLFGAKSNVDLNTEGGSGSIVAAGGADSLNLAGNYAVSAVGGSDAVTTGGGSDTISAYGTASVSVTAASGTATGLTFINHGTSRATVFAGAGSATIFGGDGGGSYHAGAAGANSLVGGSGSVSLYGRASGDVLEAGVSTGGATVHGTNMLEAGAGNETLLATSLTGANNLVAGSGADSIASKGSGLQTFYGGSGSATMSGSTMSGATNIYLLGAASAPGGNDVVTNFRLGTDVLEGLNGATITTVTASNFGGHSGALVTLSDGTRVQLTGVSASSISGNIGKSGLI
ncbi:MAG TPA: calcium-binding protein [Acidiphilium sp.]